MQDHWANQVVWYPGASKDTDNDLEQPSTEARGKAVQNFKTRYASASVRFPVSCYQAT